MRWLNRTLAALALVALAACDKNAGVYDWNLPKGFPLPPVPKDNPMTPAKVALGHALFYDTRLSVNGQMSCASCHRQDLAFTDGRAVPVGATGTPGVRNAMSLVNVAYNARFTWGNPLVDSLEHQALLPMFGEAPVEMGLSGREHDLLAALATDAKMARLFAAAFPHDATPVTLDHLLKAIASFERTIISANSPYDRYVRGDDHALSPAAQRGMRLFYSEQLECYHCHGGFNFTDSTTHGAYDPTALPYHNTGLYDVDGAGGYPYGNAGVYDVTHDTKDMGRFRAPTLRNVAVTAPYMHDGSIPTLGAVLDHYAAGGRARSKLTSTFVPGFILSDHDKRDVVAFLESLTDEALLHDPRFAKP